MRNHQLHQSQPFFCGTEQANDMRASGSPTMKHSTLQTLAAPNVLRFAAVIVPGILALFTAI